LGEHKREAKESPVLYELKQNKLWLDEECLCLLDQLLDQRKQAKMRWLPVSNRSDVNNLNNVKLVKDYTESYSEKR